MPFLLPTNNDLNVGIGVRFYALFDIDLVSLISNPQDSNQVPCENRYHYVTDRYRTCTGPYMVCIPKVKQLKTGTIIVERVHAFHKVYLILLISPAFWNLLVEIGIPGFNPGD